MAAPPVHPFRIDVSQDEVDDLARRLERVRLPEPLPGDDWDTGVPLWYLRELVERWRSFSWRDAEARLNELPHVVTEIDGQRIHAVHVPSPVPDALPLLVCHGWPGSFLELVHLVGPLTDPAAHRGDPADAVSLVIPSVPGFGFSTPVTSGGWTTNRVATAFVELMTRLGYDRFATQGGDLGAGVAPEMARVAPDRVVGVHVNGPLGAFAAEMDEEQMVALTPLEQDRMRRVGEFMERELGYIAMQSTRPGLVGVALADSPVAQLAWMVDKLRAWTHPEKTLPDEVLGTDWILTNASLYWLTATGGSAAYVGYAQDEGWGEEPASSGVPTAALQLAHDVGIRALAEGSNAIVRWTDVEDRGGHFAALEEPELLVDDVRTFLREVR